MKTRAACLVSLGLLFGSTMAWGWETQHAQALREGEDFVYRIRWGAITGGYSSLSIAGKQPMNGRLAYHIVSRAKSTGLVNTFYPVDDLNEAWLDTQTPSTLRYSKKLHEGKFRVEDEVVLDQKSGRFHRKYYRVDKNRTEEKDGTIPPGVLDIFGSLYYVRTLPLEVGKSFTIDVHEGEKVYPLVVNVTRREQVKVKAGKFDCFVVEPVLREAGIFVQKGKKLEVWLTADERRMPVLMRSEIFIGHVSAELVKQTTHPSSELAQLSSPDYSLQ